SCAFPGFILPRCSTDILSETSFSTRIIRILPPSVSKLSHPPMASMIWISLPKSIQFLSSIVYVPASVSPVPIIHTNCPEFSPVSVIGNEIVDSNVCSYGGSHPSNTSLPSPCCQTFRNVPSRPAQLYGASRFTFHVLEVAIDVVRSSFALPLYG